MTWAEHIRSTLNTLFGSQLVVELRRENEELKRERDYFKGRADRLELIVLNRANPMAAVRVPTTAMPIGRKNWQTLLKEHAEKQAKEQAEKAKEKN